jgi:catechol 2,3-dioxygenase-like lactoylglutathione lyase family enzyme
MPEVDHIGIYIKDLERSLGFYDKVFGFPVHHRMEAGVSKIAFLDIGGCLLELIQRTGAPCEAPEGSWSHVAIHIDDYDNLVSKLEAMGLELRKRTLDDGSRITFFKDPDGHDIEITEISFNQ